LSPISGTAPLTVAFTNASSGQIDAYAWDFNGDGIIDSTLRNPPPFTLATPGSYRVTLTVSGPMGEASSTTLVQVTAAGASATPNPEDDLPFASIYASPMSGDAPLTVTFENDSLGEISSYAWDFNGDGLIDSTAQNPPPYVYREPGAYSVTLDVNGPAGAGYGDDILIVVYGGEDAPTLIPTPTRTPEPDDPFASFFASPTSGDAPLTVSFVNETLGDAVRYAWDFNGDGVTDSTAQNPPSFTYIVEGTFDASLTVTGASGFSDTYTASIIVYGTAAQVPAPVARFSVSPQTGPAPLTITFTDESTGQIGGYAWDFNADGAADFRAANPPPYTFANPGTYRVALIVNGPGGVSAPFTLNITVQPPVSATPAPTVTATASPTQSVTVTLSPSATPDALDDVPSATPIGTSTPTASAMITITATVTPSFTATPTATITPVSPTPMPTSTASPTSAASPTTAPEVSPEVTADVTP
jgi:PKD repeat protein